MVSIRVPASLHVLFLAILFLFQCVKAQMNVTVDDQYGDEVTGAMPIYSPVDEWQLGTGCSDCLLRPDPREAYRGSWHYSTRRPGNGSFSIQINFSGTAVYAYFILPNYTQGAAVRTNISFSLDWNVVGSFEHDPGTRSDFVYNALGYANTSLGNTAHTFVIESVVSGTEESTVIFDRLVYTTGDPSQTGLGPGDGVDTMGSTGASTESTTTVSSGETASHDMTDFPTLSAPENSGTASNPTSPNRSSSEDSNDPSQIGIIVGSVLGGVAVVFIPVLALLCVRHRRRRTEASELTPFVVPNLPYKQEIPDVAEGGSIVSIEQGEVGSVAAARPVDRVLDISIARTGNGSESGSNTLPRSRLELTRTDSLAVIPPMSGIHRMKERTEVGPDAYPLEKDPFQRDIFDEKQERLALRSRSSPSTWDSPTTLNTGTTNWTRGAERINVSERILLEHIATLQAEVDRLQDRHSFDTEVPPPSYDQDSTPVDRVERRGRAV